MLHIISRNQGSVAMIFVFAFSVSFLPIPLKQLVLASAFH